MIRGTDVVNTFAEKSRVLQGHRKEVYTELGDVLSPELSRMMERSHFHELYIVGVFLDRRNHYLMASKLSGFRQTLVSCCNVCNIYILFPYCVHHSRKMLDKKCTRKVISVPGMILPTE